MGNVVSLIGENCKQLECLLLSRCSFTNKSMSMVFRNCSRLEMVILNDCKQLKDETLLVLANNCPLLKLLCIDDCVEISDKSITTVAVKCWMIEELSLRNTCVTDVSIKIIACNCLEIKVLNLRETRITLKSLNVIASHCRRLENLDLSNISGVMSIECLKKIVANNPELRLHLGLRNVPSDIYSYRYGLSRADWNIESHFRKYACPHCYPIVEKEAPIIARQIGIDLDKLCLEGFVKDKSNVIRSCVLHN